ncbi:SubName: Full=Uncharacterized protein {ECO:0000313/EMBL:CCA75652.1} [Serendipita indica DSM 11827]|nr:SubName: Full=Uncharacterized protein {ECO:0000313/EMBL:CCA75652.1} [Serendipita indica DSM 11827]
MATNGTHPFNFPNPFDTLYKEPSTLPATSRKGMIWKRLIVCCDGTGQSSNSGVNTVPTNVTRFARAIDTSSYMKKDAGNVQEIPQVVLYQAGVGTEQVSFYGSNKSISSGRGVERHILEAYTFFSLNYEEGDELILLGFSLGAVTARAVASLICSVGLLTKDCLDQLPAIYQQYTSNKTIENPVTPGTDPFKVYKQVVITAMGIFDTIGSLDVSGGKHLPNVPDSKNSRARIDTVYQVLAIDECCRSLSPTFSTCVAMKTVVQASTKFGVGSLLLLPGGHTDVGGGHERAFRDLSDISFAWMYNVMRRHLTFRPGVARELREPSLAPNRSGNEPFDQGWACSPAHNEYHASIFEFSTPHHRTPGQYYLEKGITENEVYNTNEWIHASVRVRMMMTDWRPRALDGFTLVHDEERNRYYWLKECDFPGKGKVHLKLNEWVVRPNDSNSIDVDNPKINMEAFLIDHEAKKIVEDSECHKKLSKMAHQKSGWMNWPTTNETRVFKFPNPFDTQYHPELEQHDFQSQDPNEQPDRSKMRKNLIVCCDGTGQSSSNGVATVPTNVTRLARAFDTSMEINSTSKVPQIVLYQTGIGTEEMSGFGTGLSSAFGYGLDRHILEAYTFFSLNFEEGDELSYSASPEALLPPVLLPLSFAMYIGLLTKDCLDKLPQIYARYKERIDTEESRKELEDWVKKRAKHKPYKVEVEDLQSGDGDPSIINKKVEWKGGKVEIEDPQVNKSEHFTINKDVIILAMGLFDTVGSLGIPEGTISTLLKPLSWTGLNNKKYQYHDTSFPLAMNPQDFRAHIHGVYQVLALDECRTSFTPTLLYDHGTKSNVGDGTGFYQVWMPGVHTDVGGGYERAPNDMSDLSFAWMYNYIKGKLQFREGVAYELRKPSLDPARSDPKATKPSVPPPVARGWACSDVHDEYHTYKFKFGGQRYRTPGQYYLKQSVEKKTIFRTSEFIHPSVRVRMQSTDWRPPALDGFKLELDEARKIYYWVKECEISGAGTVQLRLDESPIWLEDQTEEAVKEPDVDMEVFLLN